MNIYKICLIDNNRTYLERFTEFIKKHYGNEAQINVFSEEEEFRSVTSEMDYDAAFISEKDVVYNEYFTLLDNRINAVGIGKYQKPDIVWNEMKKIADSLRLQPKQAKAEVASQMSGDEYTLEIPCGCRIDKIAYGILLNNNIPGLANVSAKDEKTIVYNVKDKEKLSVRRKNLDNVTLINIMKSIVEISVQLEDYMLDVNKLFLQDEKIYIDNVTNEPLLIYDVSVSEQDIYETVVMNKEQNVTFVENILESEEHTQIVENLQEAARQSMIRKQEKMEQIFTDSKPDPYPYLLEQKSGRKIEITRALFKIGSDKDYVDLYINNEIVSRSHADILKRNDGYYLMDNNSTNHTYIDGVMIAPKQMIKLKEGSTVIFANEVFQFLF